MRNDLNEITLDSTLSSNWNCRVNVYRHKRKTTLFLKDGYQVIDTDQVDIHSVNCQQLLVQYNKT